MTNFNILGKSKEKYAFYLGNYDYKDYVKGKMANQLPKPHLGWAKRAVDIRANKTKFDRFENDTLGLNELFDKYRVREALKKN